MKDGLNLRARALSAMLAVLLPAILASAETPAGIRPDVLRERVALLASEPLEGRGSGTRGNERAARYIAAAFKNAGLIPPGTSRQGDVKARMDGSGYFQPFSFTAGVARGADNFVEVIDGRRAQKLKPGVDFEPSGVSGSGRAEGELVYVGFGIRSQEPARDDYAGIDAAGKVLLIQAGAPTKDPHSPLMEHAAVRKKAQTARDLGAAAILLVLPADSDAPRMEQDASPSDVGIPVLIVKRPLAAAWVRKAGIDLPSGDSEPAAKPAPLGIRVRLAADVRKVQKVTANIAGLLQGSDPVLRDEAVVIGAHMDHLGMGGAGSMAREKGPAIHFGADDNASGVAGVMELADYFARGARPARSLLFVCFSGEELGLLGSAHYTKNPLVPLEKTVAMINMDMIGRMRDNRLIVTGSGTSPDWNPLLDELNKEAGFQLSRSESGFGASDHQSFYLKQIPVLFFFTGLHEDYHKPSDTAEKINVADQARVVALAARCAERIARMPGRPAFTSLPPQEQAPAARFRVSLGTIPDYAYEDEGVALSGVRPGSPADRAGIRAGDIIVKFAGRSIRNVQDYTNALGEHKPGDEVEIVLKRGKELVTVRATLAAPGR